jgi:hypothetical protein
MPRSFNSAAIGRTLVNPWVRRSSTMVRRTMLCVCPDGSHSLLTADLFALERSCPVGIAKLHPTGFSGSRGRLCAHKAIDFCSRLLARSDKQKPFSRGSSYPRASRLKSKKLQWRVVLRCWCVWCHFSNEPTCLKMCDAKGDMYRFYLTAISIRREHCLGVR